MIEMFNNHIESLSYGWISFIVELLFIIVAVIAFFVIAIKHIPSKSIVFLFIANIILILIAQLIGSMVATIVYSVIFLLICIGTLIYYLPEYRQYFSKKVIKKQSKEFLDISLNASNPTTSNKKAIIFLIPKWLPNFYKVNIAIKV